MKKSSTEVLAGTTRKRAKPRGFASARAGVSRPPNLVEALARGGLTSFLGEPLDLPALEIGERIRHARQVRGLSQAELAKRVGCQQADLSDIERGKGSDGPRYATLKRLAEALGVSLPINPGGVSIVEKSLFDDLITVVLVGVGGTGSSVLKKMGNIADFEPLFSDEEWSVLRRDAHVRTVDDESAQLAGGRCFLLRVDPGVKARIHADASPFLVAEVRGGGTYHVKRAVSRWTRHQGRNRRSPAIAILGADSQMEVSANPDESLTLMMMPPAALLG
jgi:transcriptional regulator with XRE-family HTH domain